jgi:hypothetical protein
MSFNARDTGHEKGLYRVNYEVKSLSASKNSVSDLYNLISKGIAQTIARSGGKSIEGLRNIGVLVVDQDAWLKVANDKVYGPRLQKEYDSLLKNGGFLRLMDGLSDEAERGMYGLRDAVKKADVKKNP